MCSSSVAEPEHASAAFRWPSMVNDGEANRPATDQGGVKKGTGAIKEKAGKALGEYRHLEGKGKAEKAEGRIRSGVGKTKDAVREVVGKE